MAHEYYVVILSVLKLWTIMVHYSEDDSEEVRSRVWRVINNDTNCAKSFELLFDKFAEHFDRFPSVVLIALICWSYLDVKLPQDRLEVHVSLSVTVSCLGCKNNFFHIRDKCSTARTLVNLRSTQFGKVLRLT